MHLINAATCVQARGAGHFACAARVCFGGHVWAAHSPSGARRSWCLRCFYWRRVRIGDGSEGFVPEGYVGYGGTAQPNEPLPEPQLAAVGGHAPPEFPTVRAMYEFQPQQQGDLGCSEGEEFYLLGHLPEDAEWVQVQRINGDQVIRANSARHIHPQARMQNMFRAGLAGPVPCIVGARCYCTLRVGGWLGG